MTAAPIRGLGMEEAVGIPFAQALQDTMQFIQEEPVNRLDSFLSLLNRVLPGLAVHVVLSDGLLTPRHCEAVEAWSTRAGVSTERGGSAASEASEGGGSAECLNELGLGGKSASEAANLQQRQAEEKCEQAPVNPAVAPVPAGKPDQGVEGPHAAAGPSYCRRVLCGCPEGCHRQVEDWMVLSVLCWSCRVGAKGLPEDPCHCKEFGVGC